VDIPVGVIGSKILDLAGRLGRFAFAVPKVDIVPARTKFGWTGSDFMLVVTVRLRNQNDRPVFLKSLRVKHAGTWYTSRHFHSDRIQLDIEAGSLVIGALIPQSSAIDSPKIPAMEVVERFGVFWLPTPAERWPKQLSFLWEAAFSRRRNRRGNYTVAQLG